MSLHLIFFGCKIIYKEFKLEHQITEVFESNNLTVRLFIPIINLVLDSEGNRLYITSMMK